MHKQPRKAPKTPEFVDTDLSESDTNYETESDEEVPVAATSGSDDEQEIINTVLRKGIYMGEKTSYVPKIGMNCLKKMLNLSCTDKEAKEAAKQFLK